jgi:hypothetical protein
MKLILFSIMLALSLLFNHAQAYDRNRLKVIAKQLNIEEISIITINEAILPNTDLSAWVLIMDRRRNNDPRVFDLYILITDTAGKILVNNNSNNYYEFALKSGKIDTANYRLNDNTRAFGVRITTSNFSRPSGITEEWLSLYVYENNALSTVLKDFRVYEIIKFEMFEDCAGSWNESKTILIMQDKKTNGYKNILAKTSLEAHSLEGMGSAGRCLEGISQRNSSKTLKFNGTVYEPK